MLEPLYALKDLLLNGKQDGLSVPELEDLDVPKKHFKAAADLIGDLQL